MIVLWAILIVLLLLFGIQFRLMCLYRLMVSELTTANGVDYSEVRDVSNLLDFDRIGKRIISKEDLNFVLAQSPQARDLLVSQRQELALQWLSEGERRMEKLMNMHREATRINSEVDPWQEICCLINYVGFRLLTLLAKGITLILGPFVLDGFFGRMILSRSRFDSSLNNFQATVIR